MVEIVWASFRVDNAISIDLKEEINDIAWSAWQKGMLKKGPMVIN